jgi:hypothetical protein
VPFGKAFDEYESIKNDWIINRMINNLAFQLVFFGKKRELYWLGNLHGIAILYFFALMQKSNKKNQSAAADKIKELAGRVSYLMGCASAAAD